jgi:hypothetical protein
VKKLDINIIPCHPGDAPDALSSMTSHEWQGEPLESPKPVNPSSSPHYYETQSRVAFVSPLLQDERQKPPHQIISPPIQQHSMSKDKGGAIYIVPSLSHSRHHPIKSFQIRRVKSRSIQTMKRQCLDILDPIQTYSQGASPYKTGECASRQYESKRQRTRITIYICCRTHLTRERKMSRAKQQNILLRRYFYPRRDVIKWVRGNANETALRSFNNNNCPGILKKSPAVNWFQSRPNLC